MKKAVLAIAIVLLATGARAQVSQWVAYNDHFAGPRTGPNVTLYNIYANGAPASGLLKNSADGAALTVTLSVTNVAAGVTGGATSSGPSAGSPASLLFTNQIDFGNSGSNHAVQLAGSSKIVHAFSGLDPSRRYSWHGTTARGGGYSDRWTLLEISATSWEAAHSMTATGLFVQAQISSLTASQAVANFGENRLLGTYACWTNIQPNPDGTILIYQSSYHGTMPAGFGSGGTYGYGVVADRFEEFITGPATPVAITNQPQSSSVPERGTATFSLMATGSPQYIQWHRSDDGGANYAPIPGASGSSYSIASAVYPTDNGARFRAIVSNSINSVTSSVATLTVVPDTVGPTIIRAAGLADTHFVLVSFSEALDPNVIDPGSYFLYESTFIGDPTSTPYTTYSATLTNQTNVLVETDPRVLTSKYRIHVTYAQDNAFNHNILSPAPTNLPISQVLIGFDTNNIWSYSTETNLFDTGWELVGYNDSAWPSGASGLGLDTSANGVPIRTVTAYAAHSEPQFFRRHFTFPGSTTGMALSMRHVFEDGAVVYLNGQEAGRFNVNTGILSVTTRSINNQTDPTPISGPAPLPLTNVVPGDNVIAVVVIQSGATSSDCELAIELTTDIAPPVVAVPQLTIVRNPATGQVTISWTNGGILQQATTLLNNGTGWTDVPGNPNPHTFTLPASGNLFYRVR